MDLFVRKHEDCKRAQKFADRFVSLNWPRILERYARCVNPLWRW
jgi:hypothetical protein